MTEPNRTVATVPQNNGDSKHTHQDATGSTALDVDKWDPSAIASCALDHYHLILSNAGKPKEREWTVYAAVVACCHTDYWVVSCATGSKCTAVGPDGWVVRDGHAETLCRRGLVRALWMEVLGKASSNTQTRRERRLLLRQVEQRRDASVTKFRQRSDVSLHLYISDSPCGDASIYPLVGEEVQFTGAKKVVVTAEMDGEEALVPLPNSSVAREPGQQSLCALRTKSGRSNLPAHLRSTCMSCSDKLVRWSVLGLQGTGPLWSRLRGRMRLSSIVVSRDPRAVNEQVQQEALERAVVDRVRCIVDELRAKHHPTESQQRFLNDLEAHHMRVHVVGETFVRGKAQMEVWCLQNQINNTASETSDSLGKDGAKDEPQEEATTHEDTPETKKRKMVTKSRTSLKKRQRLSRPSPCGFSLNWHLSTSVNNNKTELMVGARGIRQGKTPRCDADYQRLASRLSRAHLMRLAGGCGSYRTWKAGQHGDAMKSWVMSTSVLNGWLRTNEDFKLNLEDSL